MRRFWDARAQENALFFVDNRLDYAAPDAERFWAAGRRDLDCLLELARVRLEPQDRVVEIGCGVGRLTRVLAERAREVRAVDVSAEMLDRARTLNPELTGVTWMLGDGRSLAGIPDGWAHACVSHVVFQHIPDPEITLGYIRETGRVLRPGGRAALQVSNDPTVHHRSNDPRLWPRALRSRLGRGPRGSRDPSWLGSAVDLEALGTTAAQAGMRVARVTGVGTMYCILGLQRR